VTILMKRMREELVRRNYAATTIHSYLKVVEHFSSHVNALIEEVGPDDLRSYHAYLLGTRKLAGAAPYGCRPSATTASTATTGAHYDGNLLTGLR
jgi:hypothetical protein